MKDCLKFFMSGRTRRCNCLLTLILLSCLADGLYAQENALREGDQFFLRIQYLDAIACYEKEPSDPDAHWKIAGAYVCLADLAAKNQKQEYNALAEKAARKSILMDPAKSAAHTWLAANVVKLSL